MASAASADAIIRDKALGLYAAMRTASETAALDAAGAHTPPDIDRAIVANIKEFTNNGKDPLLKQYLAIPTTDNLPPLFQAIIAGLPLTTALLLRYGADPKQSIGECGTALHFAVHFANVFEMHQLDKFCAIIHELRKYGALNGAPNQHGQTPLDLARQSRKRSDPLTKALTEPLGFMHSISQMLGLSPTIETGRTASRTNAAEEEADIYSADMTNFIMTSPTKAPEEAGDPGAGIELPTKAADPTTWLKVAGSPSTLPTGTTHSIN